MQTYPNNVHITGLARRGDGSPEQPYEVIDLGPQPSFDEAEKHIATIGVDVQ